MILVKLYALQTTGVDVNGVRRRFKILLCLDKSCCWMGEEGVGGAATRTTWPCRLQLLSVEPRYEEPRRTRRLFATGLLFAFWLFFAEE